MGMAFLELGDLPSAIEQFRSAREKGGSEFEYFRMLGDVLEKAGQIREAERQFVAGANLNPNSTPAWAALLFFYTRHRDLRPVPDVCARLETMSPGDSSYREHCTALGLETR
jgi:Flp pilus assembly protein TadD